MAEIDKIFKFYNLNIDPTLFKLEYIVIKIIKANPEWNIRKILFALNEYEINSRRVIVTRFTSFLSERFNILPKGQIELREGQEIAYRKVEDLIKLINNETSIISSEVDSMYITEYGNQLEEIINTGVISRDNARDLDYVLYEYFLTFNQRAEDVIRLQKRIDKKFDSLPLKNLVLDEEITELLNNNNISTVKYICEASPINLLSLFMSNNETLFLLLKAIGKNSKERFVKLIDKLFSSLEGRRKEVIELRYLTNPNKSLAEVAEVYKLSRGRIQQLEKEAIIFLYKSSLYKELLRRYYVILAKIRGGYNSESNIESYFDSEKIVAQVKFLFKNYRSINYSTKYDLLSENPVDVEKIEKEIN